MTSLNFQDHEWHMMMALEEAEKAYRKDEVPVGAIIVGENKEILARAHNLKEKNHNPCAHAEILAIQEAAQFKHNWRLERCTLYVTLEPCPMCLHAIGQARLETLVFGAYDKKGGALSLGYYLHKDPRLNHRFAVMGGLKHYECSKILSGFFKAKRSLYNVKKI